MPEADDVCKAIATVELRPGLGLRQGEVLLGHGVDLGDAGHRIMAFYLHDFEVTGAYQTGGYSSIVQYAQQRWDLDRRRTQELVRIGGRLRELPRIDEALCSRQIGWSKVVELCKVAVPEYEEAWLALAKSMGCVDLRTEVKLASASGKPREPGDRKGLPEVRFDVSCRVSALVREKLDLARDKLAAERGELFGDAELLEVMADLLLESEEDGTVPGRTRVPSSQFLVVLRPDEEGPGPEIPHPGIPEEVSLDLESPDRVSQGEVSQAEVSQDQPRPDPEQVLVLDGEQGRVPLSEIECGCVLCDGHVLRVGDDEGAPGGRKAKESDGGTPPWLRQKVLSRDGGRCRCCGQGRQLQAHHIRWRSRGGVTQAWNLLALCKACHSLVHAELLILKGKHEKDVDFVDREGRSLRDGAKSVDRARLVELRRVFGRRYGCETGLVPEGEEHPGERTGERTGECAGESAGQGADRRAGSAGEAAGERSPGAGPGRLVRLNDVPEEIDARWWTRHEGLMRLRKGGGLEFREGTVSCERAEPEERSAGERGRDRVPARDSARDPVSEGVWDDVEMRFLGREAVVARLRGEALGSGRRGKAFPHTLFAGPAGTGKTSLAEAVVEASGARMHRAQGPMIQDVPALLRLVMGMGEGDFLFLDEIHAVPAAVLETLYEVMEGGRLSLTLYCGHRSRCVSLRLPRLTVLGATTKPSRLPRPLLSRFGIVEHLPFYESEELTRILIARAESEGVELVKKAAQRMALCARGTAREALRLLDSVFNQLAAQKVEWAQGQRGREPSAQGQGAEGQGARRKPRVLPELERVTLRKVVPVLQRLGYSPEGYSPLEQRYLGALRAAEAPMSLRCLALALGCPEETLAERVEPWLCRLGLVAITPQGRVPSSPKMDRGVEEPCGSTSGDGDPDRGPRLLEPRAGSVASKGPRERQQVREVERVREAGPRWVMYGEGAGDAEAAGERLPKSGRTGTAVVRPLPGLALPG